MSVTTPPSAERAWSTITAAAIACSLLTPVTAAAGDLDAGRHKARTCAVCHGIDGISKRPDAPNIAGQTEYYLRTQLTDFRSGKRVHQQMNIIAQALTDQDISDLVTWYSSIELHIRLPD